VRFIMQEHKVLWGECIAGALYTNDFIRFARAVGFDDPRVLSSAPITIDDPELQEVVGEAKFFSITYRLFKLPGMLESLCEDYGQACKYKGTIPGMPSRYILCIGIRCVSVLREVTACRAGASHAKLTNISMCGGYLRARDVALLDL
jgi:hypothetical protein